MMSNFLFGVAFDRLLFNALNRYLLKNSSSIETEMRSLILPLESTRTMLVLNIYHYTLKPTLLPLSANCGSLRQSLELCIFRARRANVSRMVERVLRGTGRGLQPRF